jgi:hypothetical protein
MAIVVRSPGDLVQAIGPQVADLIKDVDWGKDELVIVSVGEKPTNGYQVAITQIMRFTDRGGGLPTLTEVSYQQSETGHSLDVLTYPLQIVKCERDDGETRFNGQSREHTEAKR